MKLRTLTALGAALTVVAAPAVADAHPNPSASTVRAHVKSADKALAKVTSLAARGNQSAAAIQLAENRLHTNAATREARRVRRTARGARGARSAVSAYRLVATQQNSNVEAYAALVAGTTGRLQEQAAGLIGQGLQGREQALAVLSSLVERLPASARPAVAQAIQALSVDGQDEIGSLFQALATSQFPPNVQEAMGQAFTLATEALNTGLGRMQGLIALLPPQAQGPAQTAIGQIETTMALVSGLLEQLLANVPNVPSLQGTGTGGTGLPDIGSLLPSLGQILPGLGGSGLPDLSGLLDGLLGGLPGGNLPIPGGGSGGGGNPIGDLLNGLLGGLLGGLS